MLFFSLMAAAEPVDVGAHHAKRNAALVVASPGLSVAAYGSLLEILESNGLDAWLIEPPPSAGDARAWLPDALARAGSGRKIALVGHGIGGTLAAQCVADGACSPDALSMLGSPLRSEPVGLLDWLAEQPLPARDLDLTAHIDTRWEGHSLLEVLIGVPLPALGQLSPAWLGTLQGWACGGLSVDLKESGLPLWAGASGLDNLAPPEWVRPMVPPAAFHRFGYLRFDDNDPDHIGLLNHKQALRMLSRWTAAVLRKS